MDVNDLLRAVQQGERPPDSQSQGIASNFAGTYGTDISPEGSSTPHGGTSGQTEGPLGSILDAILGGARSQPPPSGRSLPPQGSGPLGGILDAILRGSTSPPRTRRPDVPSPRGSGPVGGILDILLGRGGVNPANNSVLSPIAGVLSDKFGIPPALAAVIVNFATTKLIAAQASGGTHGNFQVSRLMDQMNSPDGVRSDFARDTGMAEELAAGTGIDSSQAAQMLQMVYNQLGTNAASALGMALTGGTAEPAGDAASNATGEKVIRNRGVPRHRKGGTSGRQA